MAVCHYHHDRPGVGVCMRCRLVICAACCTRVDGVNHCHACLKVLAQRSEPTASSDVGSTLGAMAVIGAAWLVLFGLGWLVQGKWAP